MKPTLKQISDQVYNEMVYQLEQEGVRGNYRYNIPKILSRVISGAIFMLYNYIDWIYKQCFPGTSEGEYLDRWSRIVGVERASPTKTNIILLVTGQVNTLIPAATEIRSIKGILFKNTSPQIISSESTEIAFESEEFGYLGEFEKEEVFIFTKPIAGINNQARLVSSIQGTEWEDDTSLREKMRQAWISPFKVMIGTKEDYIKWAQEIQFVNKVWIIDNVASFYGAFGILITTKNTPYIPSIAEIKEVQLHIDERRPVTATGIKVIAPDVLFVKIKITFDETIPHHDIIDKLKKDLSSYFIQNMNPATTIYVEKLREIISTTIIDGRYKIVFPTQEITLDQSQIALFSDLVIVS